MLRRMSEAGVDDRDNEETGGRVPAHKDFRAKYFQGFKKSTP
jgi:hypothetical protein